MLQVLNANTMCSVLISPNRIQHSGNTDNPKMLHSIGEPDRVGGDHQSLRKTLKKVKKTHRARKEGRFIAAIAVLKSSPHTVFTMRCIA